MINIILNGCNGKMGHVLASMIASQPNCQVVCGFDITPDPNATFPVYTNPTEYKGPADVLIDFSNPKALEHLLPYVTERKIPTIFATTGLSEAQLCAIHDASAVIPVFFSANMSVGVNLLIELAQKAAKFLGDGFDVEIIEKHHNQKLDAPSGTALAIANALAEVKEDVHYVYDRHAVRKKRGTEEIGIHSIRGGTIVGEHEVIFAGRDEIISVSHRADSREIFATGALKAAMFLAKQPAGFYSMKDLLNS